MTMTPHDEVDVLASGSRNSTPDPGRPDGDPDRCRIFMADRPGTKDCGLNRSQRVFLIHEHRTILPDTYLPGIVTVRSRSFANNIQRRPSLCKMPGCPASGAGDSLELAWGTCGSFRSPRRSQIQVSEIMETKMHYLTDCGIITKTVELAAEGAAVMVLGSQS